MDYTTAVPSQVLSRAAVAYVNRTRVGTRIAPLASVDSEKFGYQVFGHEAFEAPDDLATRYGGGAQVDLSAAIVEGLCEGHMASAFSPNLAPQYSSTMLDRTRKTRVASDRITLRMEYEILGVIAAATGLPDDFEASVAWDATSGTIVIERNIDTARDAVVAAGGVRPNCLALTHDAWMAVKHDPTIRSMLGIGTKASSAATVTKQAVQESFELDDLFEINSVGATSNPGQTFAGGYLGPTGYDGLLYYRAPISLDEFGRITLDAETPTFMTTFEWTEANGGTSGYLATQVSIPPGPEPLGLGTHGGVNVVLTHYRKAAVRAPLAGIRLKVLTATLA